jgi:LruC domain-containing protein
MKKVVVTLSAALFVLLFSCEQTGVGAGLDAPGGGTGIRDVLRAGDFSYESVVSVALSIGVDFEELAIVTLLNQEGEILLRGSATQNRPLEGEILVANNESGATLLLDAPGDLKQEIGIENIASYETVGRDVVLKPGDPGTAPADRDSDGVPDVYDSAPDDPAVAFEDNFPELGDGDYNDFVARYTMEEYRDGKNRLRTVNGTVEAIARAAGYDHEFGIILEHPRQQGQVTVTHYDPGGQVVETYSETTDDLSRLVIFRSTKNAFTRPGGVTMDNAFDGECDSIGHTAEFLIDFDGTGTAHPEAVSTWNANDPYLLVHDTGYDVHLIGREPLPGSNNPATPEGFRDENGYTRVLLVPEMWSYPEDRVLIETAYPEFTFWRETLGTEATDWYLFPDTSVVVN